MAKSYIRTYRKRPTIKKARTPRLPKNWWESDMGKIMTEAKFKPTLPVMNKISTELGLINISLEDFNSKSKDEGIAVYTLDSTKFIRFPIVDKETKKVKYGARRIDYFEKRKFIKSFLEVL